MKFKWLLFIVVSCFFITCNNGGGNTDELEEAFAEAEMEAVSEEMMEEATDARPVIEEIYRDSVQEMLDELFQNRVELSFVSEEDTIVVYNYFDLLWLDESHYHLMYQDDISYNYFLGFKQEFFQFQLQLAKDEKFDLAYSEDAIAHMIYSDFDVAGYGRKGKLAKYYGFKYFSGFYEESECEFKEKSCVCQDSSWVDDFRILDQGDFNQDGQIDFLISHHQTAKQGTLRSANTIVLTKDSETGDVTYLPNESFDFVSDYKEEMSNWMVAIFGTERYEMQLDWIEGNWFSGNIYNENKNHIQGFVLPNGFFLFDETNENNELLKRIRGFIKNGELEGVFNDQYSGIRQTFHAFELIEGC